MATVHLSASADKAPPDQAAEGLKKGWRIDLLQVIPGLKWLLKRRWFQFAVILPNLFFFLLFLVAGTWGSPVGNRNIIVVFVWIFWWFLLIAIMAPFFSRVWCTVCPFPFFGEWFQRGALVIARPGKTVRRNQYFGLNLRWPKKLTNIWLQNIGFLALCTFSASLLTRPFVSVMVLGGLFVVATIIHLIYRQRAFCNYVCPVSGFLSLYAMTSMTELRAKDQAVCKQCRGKDCLAGSDQGWGCPWFLYPSKLDRNNYCGLCMECLKTCTYDNIAINIRPFCSDTKLKGYDEAWKAFIMLALALLYSAIYVGPWGLLKDAANVFETQDLGAFAVYASALWLAALVLIPGVFAGCVWLGRRLAGGEGVSWKDSFLAMCYPLVPLGLLGWIAFSFPLLFINGSYILVVISDPMGWGWNLLGTANLAWTPVLPSWMPHLQIPLLLIGLYYALKTGFAGARRLYGDARQATLAFAPTALLLGLVIIAFLIIFVR